MLSFRKIFKKDLKQKKSARSASQECRITMFHLSHLKHQTKIKQDQTHCKDDTPYSKANTNDCASCNVVRSDREQTNCRRCARTRRPGEWGQKNAKGYADIQQLKFAGGQHYAAGRMLKYARADGMACSHSPVVVCVIIP